VGRSVGKAPLPERAVTSMLPAAEAEAPPVFVDPSGTRRRRLRLTAYAVGLLLVAVLAAVWLSQLGGGPAEPPDRTPCPTASSAEGCAR
jgi:ferric-dicitrate binding protein FerR (iron transport regulator)